MSHDKFQFAWPGIHEAGPFRLEEYVAAVLDEETKGFAAEGGANGLALLHDLLVDVLNDRQILVMIEIHYRASNEILRQIAKCWDRSGIHMRNDASRRVAYGKLGSLRR